MADRDLPETATPWTDPLGNVWCVKLEEDGISCRLCLLSDGRWRELGVPAYLPFFPEHLLAGLGRTLPPVPSRKRVAQGATRLVPTRDRAQATRFADTDAVFTRLRRDFAIPFITSHRDGDLWYIGVPCPEMPAFWSGPWYVREEVRDA